MNKLPLFHSCDSLLTTCKLFTLKPQQSMPDVFIWVISSGKRTAYQRIPARDLIYSIVDEESGRDCGRVQTLFLKVLVKVICV